MRGIVRASVYATGLRMIGAKIAGGRFFLYHGLFLFRMIAVTFVFDFMGRSLCLRREGVHVDISVGTIFRA